MIVEVRTYKVKEGLRERFLEFFRDRADPAQRAMPLLEGYTVSLTTTSPDFVDDLATPDATASLGARR